MAAASGEQEANSQGRIRTPVRWGQGIPLQPARTIQRTVPKQVNRAVQTTSQVSGVQTSILSNILPGHASVTDAVTRLQRERDLALRRIDELHEHYKKETERKDEADRKSTLINMEVRNSQVREAQKETAHYKKQFENAMSLVETQKLSIKMLQDELGEEAEFDAEETAQMRSVRRECETRINNYEDRIAEVQSDMQKEIDKQAYLLKKVAMMRAVSSMSRSRVPRACLMSKSASRSPRIA